MSASTSTSAPTAKAGKRPHSSAVPQNPMASGVLVTSVSPVETKSIGAREKNRDLAKPAFSPGMGFSRDEMNLAEFPLTVLSTRVDPTVKTLEFTDHFRSKSGELIERKWIITGADKFGLPTSTDDDVILGLIRLTMDRGFRERKVHFTRYELLRALRWSTEGRSYSRLVKSLDRLSGVRIRATNSFYDNSSKSYQTCNFGIIDAYEINDNRNRRIGDETETGEPPKSFFIWSEMLFDSFNAGFIKKLDLDLYFSLRSAVSRRLYRYLDKHFYFKNTVERPLMFLAFQKLGVSRNYRFVSSVRQQIEPAAEELKQVGFLESFEYLGSGEQTIIRFIANPQVVTPVGARSGAANASPQNGAAYSPAKSSYVTESTATFLHAESVDPSEPFNNGANGQFGHDNDSQEVSRSLLGGPLAGEGTRVIRSPVVSSMGNTSGTSRVGAQDSHQSFGENSGSFIERGLVERGIAPNQAEKLARQSVPHFSAKIADIFRYYDHLVNTDDPKVSKSKVGFLYRAVEQPERFLVPAEFCADGSTGTGRTGQLSMGLGGTGNRRANKRPEHKLFRAEREKVKSEKSGVANSESKSVERSEGTVFSEYKQFLDVELSKRIPQLSATEIENISLEVERKMACLKGILSPAMFKEARDGCIQEELGRKTGIPDFKSWAAAR